MPQTSSALAPVDSAWLHMDHPTNLMMVTGIALLEGQIDDARYRRTIAARLLPLDRFRMRVVDPGGLATPRWEVDPYLDVDAHIHRVALPAPGDMATLQEFLGDLASSPLDMTKPLWQVHLVENVLGGSAMVLRFHHCIGDGTAMKGVLHRLMDTTPDAPIEPPPPPAKAPPDLLHTLLGPLAPAFDGAQRAVSTLLHEGSEALAHPEHLLELTGAAAGGAAALTRVLTLSPEVRTPLKGQLGVQKKVAWSQRVPLEEVREIAQRAGAKINDVLLAAVAGALRDYLHGRGTPVARLEVRAVVPVDLRPPERMLDLGNEFGLVFLALPLGLADPLARLAEVKRRMDELKRSPEALVFFGLLNFFGRTPAQVEEQAVNLFGSKATAVMTNVRGPSVPLYVAGSRITNMMFWVPQAGRLALGVSIMSYDGGVTLGVIADAGLVPDPQAITARFEHEFAELLDAIHVA